MASTALQKYSKDVAAIAIDFTKVAEFYINVVKNILSGDNPAKFKSVTASVEYLGAVGAGNTASAATLGDYSAEYDKTARILAEMSNIKDVINDDNYYRRAAFVVSSSDNSRMTAARDKAAALIGALKAVDDSKVLAAAVKDVSNDEIHDFLVKSNINGFTTKLLAYAIKAFKGPQRAAMIELVEKQKDIVLNAAKFTVDAKSGVEALTARTLIPLDQCKPVQDWAALAGAGPSVVVINMSVGTPVQFNLRGLIDLEYITENGLKTSPFSGVTKKILERFNTAETLNGAPSTTPPVQVYKGADESLPPRIFQLLTAEFAREMTGTYAPGVSGRPHAYNKIQETTIIANMMDPRAPTIAAEYEVAKATKFDSGVVRAAITERLVSNFKTVAAGAKTLDDLRDAAVDQDYISTTLIDILVMSTGLRGRKSPEHIITYLSKFDGIIRAFTKEVEKRWGTSGISRRIFVEYTADKLITHAAGVYTTILDAAMLELDKTGSWSEYDMSVKEYFLDKKLL